MKKYLQRLHGPCIEYMIAFAGSRQQSKRRITEVALLPAPVISTSLGGLPLLC
jgi:hypothetical protein